MGALPVFVSVRVCVDVLPTTTVLKLKLVEERESAPSGGGALGPTVAQPTRKKQKLNAKTSALKARNEKQFERCENTPGASPLRLGNLKLPPHGQGEQPVPGTVLGQDLLEEKLYCGTGEANGREVCQDTKWHPKRKVPSTVRRDQTGRK